jgi:dolichyl-phosphate-mannose-protein mannosyltransferase
VRAIALGLGAICLLAFVRTSLTVVRHIPLNWNEGWNAFHTADIAAGRPLYPDPATATLFTNYPPLSFYVITPIGRALGDHLIAGRLVAFVSLLAWIVLVAFIARRLRCSWASSAFGALVLAAGLFVFSDFYVGVNDPQMLGHALQALGLVVLLRERRTTASLAACALLFAAGVLVKNNLIVLPLATVAWLCIDDRRSAWRLVAFGVAAGIVATLSCLLLFGPQIAAHVFSPRGWAVSKAVSMGGGWMLRMALPLVVAAWLAISAGSDRGAQFAVMYTVTAIVASIASAAGDGVYWNAMFEAECALAIVAAVATDRAARRLPVALAFLAAPALALAVNASIHWLSPRFWFDPRWSEASTAADDIEFVRSHDGGALCEDLALCYWGGKTTPVDFFNLHERLRLEPWRADALVRRLNNREYAVAEVEDDERNLGPQFMEALARNYRIDHKSQWGTFWVPK